MRERLVERAQRRCRAPSRRARDRGARRRASRRSRRARSPGRAAACAARAARAGARSGPARRSATACRAGARARCTSSRSGSDSGPTRSSVASRAQRGASAAFSAPSATSRASSGCSRFTPPPGSGTIGVLDLARQRVHAGAVAGEHERATQDRVGETRLAHERLGLALAAPVRIGRVRVGADRRDEHELRAAGRARGRDQRARVVSTFALAVARRARLDQDSRQVDHARARPRTPRAGPRRRVQSTRTRARALARQRRQLAPRRARSAPARRSRAPGAASARSSTTRPSALFAPRDRRASPPC